MVIKAGGKKYELGQGGLLRWKFRGSCFHILHDVEDDTLIVFCPDSEVPKDLSYGGHELCSHFGK